MAHRDYRPGYRGSHYERDDDSALERERGYPWGRQRERQELAGRGDYDREFSGDWSERGYRGGWRDGGFADEWHARRSPYRGPHFRGAEWPAHDYDEIEDYDYAGPSMGRGRGFSGPYPGELGRVGPGGMYGGRGPSAGFYPESGRYWGGAASGYGPSTGYGYGTAGSYIGAREYSWSREGGGRHYVGRGPRGYKRSDERIREEINERLTRHPAIDATDVEVGVEGGLVTLRGVVEDRRAKRLAEDIAEDVWGVDDISNELKVRRGFLASLTGERADEREVTRTAAREIGGASENEARAKGRVGPPPGIAPGT